MKEMSQTWEEKLVKTERLQHERQQALEKMGISVQASGIQVEKNKYYLVNLNDDPSLNELLVYYLKVCTCRYTCRLFFVQVSPFASPISVPRISLCFRKGPSWAVVQPKENRIFSCTAWVFCRNIALSR